MVVDVYSCNIYGDRCLQWQTFMVVDDDVHDGRCSCGRQVWQQTFTEAKFMVMDVYGGSISMAVDVRGS